VDLTGDDPPLAPPAAAHVQAAVAPTAVPPAALPSPAEPQRRGPPATNLAEQGQDGECLVCSARCARLGCEHAYLCRTCALKCSKAQCGLCQRHYSTALLPMTPAQVIDAIATDHHGQTTRTSFACHGKWTMERQSALRADVAFTVMQVAVVSRGYGDVARRRMDEAWEAGTWAEGGPAVDETELAALFDPSTSLGKFAGRLRACQQQPIGGGSLSPLDSEPQNWSCLEDHTYVCQLRRILMLVLENVEQGSSATGPCSTVPALSELAYHPHRVVCVVRRKITASIYHFDCVTDCIGLSERVRGSIPLPFRMYFRAFFDLHRTSAEDLARGKDFTEPSMDLVRNLALGDVLQTLVGVRMTDDGVVGAARRRRRTGRGPGVWGLLKPVSELDDRGLCRGTTPENGACPLFAVLAPDGPT